MIDSPLEEFFRIAFRDSMKSIHTMLPGVIESFDAETQRAKVAIAVGRALTNGNIIEYPPLLDVPVQTFRVGGFSMTFPVTKGDEVAVFFAERSMDLFLESGPGSTPPKDTRFFDLSDAFAVPGLLSSGNVPGTYSEEDFVLSNDAGDQEIRLLKDKSIRVSSGALEMIIQNGKISITNDSGELVDLLSRTLQQLSIETVTPGSPGTPVPLNGAAVYTAIKTLVDSFKIT